MFFIINWGPSKIYYREGHLVKLEKQPVEHLYIFLNFDVQDVVGCWCGYLSGARCRLAYGPADATATHCLLLQ